MKRVITSKWMWYSAEYQWVQRTHVQSSGVSSCTAPARTGGWVPLPGVDRWYEDTVQTSGLSQSEARSEDSWPIGAGDGVRLVAPGWGQCPVFTGHSSPLSPCQQATLPSSQPLTRTREHRQWSRQCLIPVTVTRAESGVRMMISQFWNLCRACPALDVDKVSSKCQYLIAVCRARCHFKSNLNYRVLRLGWTWKPQKNLFFHKSEGTFWIPCHVWEECFF